MDADMPQFSGNVVKISGCFKEMIKEIRAKKKRRLQLGGSWVNRDRAEVRESRESEQLVGWGGGRQNDEIGRKVKRKKEKKITRIELETGFKNME